MSECARRGERRSACELYPFPPRPQLKFSTRARAARATHKQADLQSISDGAQAPPATQDGEFQTCGRANYTRNPIFHARKRNYHACNHNHRARNVNLRTCNNDSHTCDQPCNSCNHEFYKYNDRFYPRNAKVHDYNLIFTSAVRDLPLAMQDLTQTMKDSNRAILIQHTCSRIYD